MSGVTADELREALAACQRRQLEVLRERDALRAALAGLLPYADRHGRYMHVGDGCALCAAVAGARDALAGGGSG